MVSDAAETTNGTDFSPKFSTLVYLFEILYGIKFGNGLHTVDLDLPDMINILKVLRSLSQNMSRHRAKVASLFTRFN